MEDQICPIKVGETVTGTQARRVSGENTESIELE